MYSVGLAKARVSQLAVRLAQFFVKYGRAALGRSSLSRSYSCCLGVPRSISSFLRFS